MTRDEARASVGRCGKIRSGSRHGPSFGKYWYGRVREVHSSGDYVKFDTMNPRRRPHWVHRDEVTLHEEQT